MNSCAARRGRWTESALSPGISQGGGEWGRFFVLWARWRFAASWPDDGRGRAGGKIESASGASQV